MTTDAFRLTRKIGFGLRPDEVVPDDVVGWAKAQLSTLPEQLGVAAVPAIKSPSKVLVQPEPWPEERILSLEKLLDNAVRLEDVFQANRKLEGDSEKWGAVMDGARAKYFSLRWDALRRCHQPVYNRQPVFERFSWFWANHFTVSASNNAEDVFGHYFDKAINANMIRDFRSLLYDVTTHPGMQVFLDGPDSIGPRSHLGKEFRARGLHADINENLGRELLELHTLSPAGGYTQDDVVGAAKILTGHAFTPHVERKFPSKERWKVFFAERHEPGTKTVLGQTYAEGGAALKRLTDFLAVQDATIQHISRKLARHFVAEDPTDEDVAYIAERWKGSDGNLPEIHGAVIERAVARSDARKFQPPELWLYQMLRSSGANLFNGWDQTTAAFDLTPFDFVPREPIELLEELGQSYWIVRQPNGFSDAKSDWISPEHFDRRLRFAQLTHKAGMPWLDAETLLDRMQCGPETRDLVNRGKTPSDRFTLLFCSPEFTEA